MNRIQSSLKIMTFVLVISILTAPASALAAESMGMSGDHDLDQLWSRAQAQFDLNTQDAVVLLESRHVSILADGDLRTRVHRVVWIGAGVAIRGYADLRVPFNSETSTLTVNTLRTWRDNRWWPDDGVSPTAVVETLPYAVARADDYTNMRETMLLHDGVELPCIMETDYEIVERAGAARGAEGLCIFSQVDPAVRVDLTLDTSQGKTVFYRSGNGAPEPVVTRGTGGRDTYLWTMDGVERMGAPHISDPAVAEPYVAWSTWPDWAALGGMIAGSFNEAAVLSDAMSDTLAARLEDEPTPASKVRRIAALVDVFTRSIRYDPRFWPFSPRSASRTWETAYGHGLDRAVLAAALFRGAGFEADPVYRSIGPGGVDQNVPGLSRFEDIGVRVTGDALIGYYDPTHGTFAEGPGPFRGRAVWQPDDEPPHFNDPAPISHFELVLTVKPGEEEEWTGSGFVNADGLFCPYDEMVGFDNEALGYIGRVAASVINGANVDGFNPETFNATRITGGFGFEVQDLQPDHQDRTVISLDAPAGGIVSRLPSDVHLYNEKRTSPVVLSGPMTQRVTLRLKIGDREILQLPEMRDLENDAGRFTLRASEKDGWITVERALTLEASVIPPQRWPDLRALLLEEADPSGRAIYVANPVTTIPTR